MRRHRELWAKLIVVFGIYEKAIKLLRLLWHRIFRNINSPNYI